MRFVSEPSDVEPSAYDQNGPIDYDALKKVISEKGPYILQFTDWQVNFTINITPCRLEGCECDEDVISIVQSSGFTSLSTPRVHQHRVRPAGTRLKGCRVSSQASAQWL